MNTRPRLLSGLPGFCLLLGACGALAAEPTPASQPATASTPVATAGAGAAEPAAAQPIAQRDASSLVVTVHPDGSRSAVLDDSFMSTSVARIDAEGRIVIGCVSTREEYDAFFAAEALPDGLEVR